MIYFREKLVKRKNDWIRNCYPDLEVEKENKENKRYCWCWNLYAGVIGIVRLSDDECESGRERQNESRGQSDGENEGGSESEIRSEGESGSEIEENFFVAFFAIFSSLRLNFFLLKP